MRRNNDLGPQVISVIEQAAQHRALRIAQKQGQTTAMLRQPGHHRGIVALPCVPLVDWRVQNFQAQTQRRFAQYQNIPAHKGAAVVGRARRKPLLAPAALAFAPVVQQVIHPKNA